MQKKTAVQIELETTGSLLFAICNARLEAGDFDLNNKNIVNDNDGIIVARAMLMNIYFYFETFLRTKKKWNICK